MKHYILMADIIESGDRPQNILMQNFEELIKKVNKTFKNTILSPLTITLGDEFQGVISNLTTAVNLIICLEEEIVHQHYNFQLRYVLNYGEIETPINKHLAYGMLGKGLTQARNKLNEIKSQKIRYNISLENQNQQQILSEAFKIFGNIREKWSVEKDYELVSNFLKFEDYKAVSLAMKKNRSLIWKREKSLNMESYKAIKHIILITTQ
jgi:hypothetical protein